MSEFSKAVVNADWPTSGGCKLAIVGEAPGFEEVSKGRPFVGPSGRLLEKALNHVGLKRSECLITNVFNQRPPGNDEGHFFSKRSEAKKTGWSRECPHPVYGTTGYVRPEWVGQLDRVKSELEKAKPPVVMALGACALWALTGESKIGAYRGSVMQCRLLPELPVIPTFHPANVLRTWTNLPLFISDFTKAVEGFIKAGGDENPQRYITLLPTIEDLHQWYEDYIRPLEGTDQPLIYDIETTPEAGGQVKCIGFAVPGRAIVVPFWSNYGSGLNYWKTPEEEAAAVQWVTKVLGNSKLLKCAHNGNYDIQWLARKLGVVVRGHSEDTMLMAHALQPEMKKGLGVLVSLYCKAPAWKQFVNHNETNKAGA